jgi:hypothetical protein
VRATPLRGPKLAPRVTAAVFLSDGRVCRQLATPRLRGRASCRGVASPPRVFGEPQCCRVHGVDARPPCRFATRVPKHPDAPTSRRPHRGPSQRSKAPGVPLSGLGSPAQFHRRHTARPVAPRCLPAMLRPRFFPLQRLASREEPLTPGGIPTHRLRCVRRVSHPLDALLPPRPARLVSSRFRSWGSPSRLVPARCRTPSRAPDPSGFRLGPFGPRLPFRDRAHHADPARGPGV